MKAINQTHRNRIFFISIILFMAACTFLFHLLYYNHGNRLNEIVGENIEMTSLFKSKRNHKNDYIDVYRFTLTTPMWVPSLKPVDETYFVELLKVEQSLKEATQVKSYDLDAVLQDLSYIAVAEDGQYLFLSSDKHGFEYVAYSKHLNHGYYVVLKNEETP